MKYSPAFFKRTMPEWKRKKDSIVAQWIHRPISFLFSSLFASMGLSPNQVSFLSLFVGIAAVICFLMDGIGWWLAGALLVNLWSITDSADGNMARSIGGQPYGDFIDALSSYFLVGFMFPAMGMAVYRAGGVWFKAGNPYIIYIGALASAFDTMTRLFFQKMKNSTYELEQDQGIVRDRNESVPRGRPVSRLEILQSRVESELGLGGWNMIAIIVCALTYSFDLFILFYALYYGAMFLAGTVYVLKKTGCLRRTGVYGEK